MELKIVPTVRISKLRTWLTTRVVIRLKSETLGFESKDCQAVWLSERGEVRMRRGREAAGNSVNYLYQSL